MIGPLTYLDIALLAITSISGLLAMYRGFTREVLSIVSWISAACAVFYLIFFQNSLINDFSLIIGTKPQLAQIILSSLLFVVVLLIVHMITARISEAILDGPMGIFDRMLGLIFGVARGFLLVVIPYMFWYGIISPQNIERDIWVKNSFAKPYIESAASTLNSFILDRIPENLDSLNSDND
ncbi:MAG TPA: hypothetical protein TECP_00097 [Hyphomicrobiaceae bacterium MAG_BT-2024]